MESWVSLSSIVHLLASLVSVLFFHTIERWLIYLCHINKRIMESTKNIINLQCFRTSHGCCPYFPGVPASIPSFSSLQLWCVCWLWRLSIHVIEMQCVKLVDYWMQWMATIGNLTYQCCPMLRHMRERMLRQTLLVLVTRDTQMIQSSDLPTQRCEIWRYVISRLLSEHQTSFQAFCRYVNCWWHKCLAQVANFNWQNLLW